MQKVKALEIGDENMAGSRWGWTFWVTRRKNGLYSGMATQSVQEPPVPKIPAVYPLHTGQEVWHALNSIVEEAGYSISLDDVDEIVGSVARLDLEIALQVRSAALGDGESS